MRWAIGGRRGFKSEAEEESRKRIGSREQEEKEEVETCPLHETMQNARNQENNNKRKKKEKRIGVDSQKKEQKRGIIPEEGGMKAENRKPSPSFPVEVYVKKGIKKNPKKKKKTGTKERKQKKFTDEKTGNPRKGRSRKGGGVKWEQVAAK